MTCIPVLELAAQQVMLVTAAVLGDLHKSCSGHCEPVLGLVCV